MPAGEPRAGQVASLGELASDVAGELANDVAGELAGELKGVQPPPEVARKDGAGGQPEGMPSLPDDIPFSELWAAIVRAEQMIADVELLSSQTMKLLLRRAAKLDSDFMKKENALGEPDEWLSGMQNSSRM